MSDEPTPVLPPAYLTDLEFQALDMTSDLTNLVIHRIIGNSPSRQPDVDEFVFHIHAIQKMLMGQAAARAYPTPFRLLGGMVKRG